MRRGAAGWVLVLLVLTLPHAASADSLPTIVNVTLDAQNHAVVTWTKLSSQETFDVKWTKDGTDGAPWGDGSYGTPLADCRVDLRPNPAGDSQWLFGRSCKGDTVANSATKHVTREIMQVGVYYFQVSVNGHTDHADGSPTSFAPHFSGVLKFTVDPAKARPPDEETEETEETEEAGTIGEAAVKGKLERDGEAVTGDVTIREYDELETSGSPAKLVFKDGGALALDKQSKVDFAVYRGKKVLTLQRGRIWYSAKSKPRVFVKEIWGNGGNVDVVPRAATFTLQNVRANVSRLRVYKGTVNASVRWYAGGRTGIHRVRVSQGFEALLVRRRQSPQVSKLTPEPPFWK